MIAVRLMGGLGNQMFQYATGRRLADKNNTGLVLDLSHYENQPAHEVPRFYELDCFSLKVKMTKLPAESGGLKSKFGKPVNLKVINETGLGFNPEILKLQDNVLLVGHWLSEKYFKGDEQRIIKDFKFINKISPQKQAVSELISKNNGSVSLQIRRGDFVNHPGSSKFHGTVPMAYYNKATKLIAEKIKDPVFFVISDDPVWCRENLKLSYPTIFVEHIPGTGFEDMNLMSQCRHHIIANSTFGWWGAWLNSYRAKIVTSPAKWVQDSSVDTSDLLPKRWIKI